jgi:hypothetical protein
MAASTSWDSLVREFSDYRLTPSPTGFSYPRPFTASGRALTAAWRRRYSKNAKAAINRLTQAVATLHEHRLLPATPSGLTQRHVTRIAQVVHRRNVKPKPALRLFWEAFVLYTSGFRCRYCGRHYQDVLHETRGVRTSRLVVDHCVPLKRTVRKRHMRRFLDLDVKNCVCACWACNTLKANWPERAFATELRSLAKHVLGES